MKHSDHGFPRRAAETVLLVGREALGDKIHVRSGFLALWALEAFVPMLLITAVGASLFGYQSDVSDLLGRLLQSSIFGSTSESASTIFDDLVDRVGLATLGVTGLLSMLFVIYQLYGAALYDYSELVRAPSGGRGWGTHAVLFPVFMVFAAVLFVGGNVATGMLWTRGPGALAMPLLLIANLLVLAFGLSVFPRRRLPYTSIFIGSAVGAVWLELLKTAFWLYTTSGFGSESLNATYWWLGFIPIAFLWMQLLWFAVLLSAVTARVATHFDEAMSAHHRWRTCKTLPPHRWSPDERLARHVWRETMQADPNTPWIPLTRITKTLMVRPAMVRDILDVWEQRGWVQGEGQGYRPTDDAADVTEDDAVQAWRQDATWDQGRTDDDPRNASSES